MPMPPAGADTGQRFLIEAEGYPNDGWNVIGWSTSREGASRMQLGIGLAPRCTATRLTDRDPSQG